MGLGWGLRDFGGYIGLNILVVVDDNKKPLYFKEERRFLLIFLSFGGFKGDA